MARPGTGLSARVRPFRTWLVCLAPALLAPPVGAAAPADSMPENVEEWDLESLLEEPVVTASGGEAEERKAAAAHIIVVGREEIRRRGWRSIAEVLSHQSGLYIVDDLVIPSVGVRGATGGLRAGSRIVKVMINGITVNYRPDLTAFLGPEFLPLSVVERIEIVQGPLSALYGANAFLATINIITREPASEGKPSTEAAAAVGFVRGHLGTGVSLVTVQGNKSRGLVLAFSREDIDRSGVLLPRTFDGQETAIKSFDSLLGETSQNDRARPLSVFLSAHLGQLEGEWGRLVLQGGMQRLDASAEFQVNSVMSHRSRVALANDWVALRYAKRWSKALAVDADVAYSWGAPTDEARLYLLDNHNAYYTPRFGYRALNTHANFSWAPVDKRLRLRLGADLELDRERILHYRQTFLIPNGDRKAGDELDLIESATTGQQTIRDFGLALQASSFPAPDLLPGLRLQGDLRLDLIRFGSAGTPSQLSWRLGVVYLSSDQLTMKFVAGRAFQMPSGVLMFAEGGYGIANNVLGNHGANRIGIPRLRPQVADGAELVASVELNERISFDVDVFLQRVGDRIRFEQLATDFVAVNSSSETAAGLLFNGRLRFGPAEAYTNVSAQGTFVGGRLSFNPSPQYPSFFGGSGVLVDLKPASTTVGGHLRWAGARGSTQSNSLVNDGRGYTLPAFATLDLSLSAELPGFLEGSSARASIWGRNVLDHRYAEPGFSGFDIPTLGRTVWFELRQAF